MPALQTNRRTEQRPPTCLFPIAVPDETQFLALLDNLQQAVERGASIATLLDRCWHRYLLKQEQHTLALVAASVEELHTEIQICRRTWSSCWTAGREWKTPGGSRLAVHPSGPSSKIAFVYPGIGSLYPGYSRELRDAFPNCLNELPVPGDELMSMIHPNQLWNEDSKEPWSLESNIVAQAEATVSLTYVWSHVLQRVFDIRPSIALGYSLGEIAMFASCGSWDRPQELSSRFREGRTFQQALSGQMTVLQHSADLRDVKAEDWQACVASLPRPWIGLSGTGDSKAFVTHINTPREVVVAGADPDVARWVSLHDARGRIAPSKLVYHCAAVEPEARMLHRLFELPVASRPETDLVGMAPFSKVPHNPQLIARSLVNTALKTVDFPQIVRTAYGRGARVFVEIGPRNSCTNWIHQILAGQPFLSVSTDQKGTDCSASIVKMLATLVTHRIPISLQGTWEWLQSLVMRAAVANRNPI